MNDAFSTDSWEHKSSNRLKFELIVEKFASNFHSRPSGNLMLFAMSSFSDLSPCCLCPEVQVFSQ